jgi:hypothetical protein
MLTRLPTKHIHIIGAGPCGLILTALLQSIEGLSIRLYEKRREYTRKRMVKLSPYLVAESVEAYRGDDLDGENVDAIFNPEELESGFAYRQEMPLKVRNLLKEWTQGFCPVNTIEKSLSDLIDQDAVSPVERIISTLDLETLKTLVGPEDIVIDCTGCKSLLRDTLVPQNGLTSNTNEIRLEHAVVITFLYDREYDCNEYCKYYKNKDNEEYKFIPAVDRTCQNGGISHVTGIINISDKEYEALPPQFDGQWLRENFPRIATSMDRFIAKIIQETHGKIVGDLEGIRIPLNLYRARHSTNLHSLQEGPPFSGTPVFLLGDSAIGSPYFQSISLGFECAMYFAGLMRNQNLSIPQLMGQYEQFIYKQWLRVYMRSKQIKHNKDLFERLDDPFRLLEKLHIY